MTNPNFMNGVPELLILRLLETREMYGYELVQAIRAETYDAIKIGEGVVYPVLHALEREGALKSRRKPVNGRTRVYYTVTRRGTKHLAGLVVEWSRITGAVGNLVRRHVMQPCFDQLKERLLRSGIAPRHVRRYVAELCDHFDDLVRDETARGLSQSAAEDAARARIGNDDTLAAVMLARPELLSLTARYPWAVFGLGPVLMLALIVFASVMAEGGLLYLHLIIFRQPGLLHPVSPPWIRTSVAVWNGLMMYAAPLFVAALLCLVGSRQRITVAWIALGLAIVCFVGSFHEVVVKWSDVPTQPSALSVGFTLSPPFLVRGVYRVILNLALAGAAYWLWLRNAGYGAASREAK